MVGYSFGIALWYRVILCAPFVNLCGSYFVIYLLYEECKGCDKDHTVLWMTLELLKLKASREWSDTSFSALLELLTKLLPKPNGLASST
jgi:hypothetical protein